MIEYLAMKIDPRRIEVMDDRVAEIMRGKSPAEKIQLASTMWRSARTMVFHSIKHAHPEWNADQIHAETVRRITRGAA